VVLDELKHLAAVDLSMLQCGFDLLLDLLKFVFNRGSFVKRFFTAHVENVTSVLEVNLVVHNELVLFHQLAERFESARDFVLVQSTEGL
jgi:hypothetical protein